MGRSKNGGQSNTEVTEAAAKRRRANSEGSYTADDITVLKGLELTVQEFNAQADATVAEGIGPVWVTGELSRFTSHASGHWYFTLKDEAAQVDCVMFRGRAAALDWQPAEGMRVEARALVTLYEPRGRFQLNVESMRRAGLGPLYERFLKLKAKLEAEGVFDPQAKRPIPEHPRQIGILTSLQAAALRDRAAAAHQQQHIAFAARARIRQHLRDPRGGAFALDGNRIDDQRDGGWACLAWIVRRLRVGSRFRPGQRFPFREASRAPEKDSHPSHEAS